MKYGELVERVRELESRDINNAALQQELAAAAEAMERMRGARDQANAGARTVGLQLDQARALLMQSGCAGATLPEQLAAVVAERDAARDEVRQAWEALAERFEGETLRQSARVLLDRLAGAELRERQLRLAYRQRKDRDRVYSYRRYASAAIADGRTPAQADAIACEMLLLEDSFSGEEMTPEKPAQTATAAQTGACVPEGEARHE